VRALAALDESLVLCANDADWSARAWRDKGEALALLQRPAEALAAYERALALNEKVGVKRKITSLRKLLATS